MVVVICPYCGEGVFLSSPIAVGHRVPCPGCEVPLQVVRVDPIQLEWVLETPSGRRDRARSVLVSRR
jgi:hypothetical protein